MNKETFYERKDRDTSHNKYMTVMCDDEILEYIRKK